MMTKEAVILQMARTIWKAEHPRKDWIAHPDYSQATVQQRYIATARVCFRIATQVYKETDQQSLADIAAGRPLNTVTSR